MRRFLISTIKATVLSCLICASVCHAQPPSDADWEANAILKSAKARSFTNLGAAQGVSIHDDKIYIYGDVYSAKPRVGVIREYDRGLRATGRVVWLTRNGKPLLTHPTGLTWDEHFGCFVGDTVDQKAKIYQIDWQRALQDGNLDRAVETVIEDDAATNGCRPEFVTVDRKRLLATADYGDKRAEIRLMHPKRLLVAKNTSSKGVILHRITCGPFNQNLYWDEDAKQLTCIQNVIAGRGWQLDVLDLHKAIARGNADASGVRVRKITLPPHTELEGYRPLSKQAAVFVTAYPRDNVVTGVTVPTKPVKSPRGYNKFSLK